jgi:homoserine kinase
VLACREPGLFGCVLSGAGPSILIFYERGNESALARVERIMERHGQPARAAKIGIAPHGYTLGDGPGLENVTQAL